jgi:CheY-like chemotaxis protein
MSSRVLIVDDALPNVEMLEEFLADESESIRGLTDSKRVDQVFIEFGPDIVLLDLHMPDPDGLEILRRLRSARASLGFVPFIVLTGMQERSRATARCSSGPTTF